VLSRRRAWAVVAVATLTMTVSYVDRTTLAVLAPKVTSALGIDETQYGWLASAFSLAYLVSTPLSGWWIDRAGARRGLARSVLVWSSVAALHAIVPGFAMLFCFRIALGVAEGPGFPGAAQTVQRMLPESEQARGFGVLFTGSSIGAMLTPPLATWLYVELGWRAAFLGTAVVGLAWIPAWLAVTRAPHVRAQLDVAIDRRPARPTFGDLLASPIVQRGLVAVIAASPVVAFGQSWGSKYLVAVYHVPQAAIGHFLWLPPLCFDVGAILFGDLAARTRRGARPPRVLYAIGMTLVTTIALLAFANDPDVPSLQSPWGAMAVMSVAMFGSGTLWTLLTSDMLGRLPSQSISLAGGMLAGGQSLAYIITNPLIGYALDNGHGYAEIAVWLGAWIVPGSLAWIAWRPADRLEHKV
jgi:MFS transporter, ACS family, aldohexuronate transporter